MARYNEFYYLNGYYGIKSALAFSAEPIVATAIDYDRVDVTWLAPTGAYSDFRIVRNQNGFPQTQEDGVILYSSAGAPTDTLLSDSSAIADAPLVGGRFVFYRAWIRKTDTYYWVPAGDAYTLLPSPHNLSVGRDAVYTSVGQDGFSTVDDLVWFDSRTSPFVSSTHERFLGVLPAVMTSATNSGLDAVENTYDRFGEPTGSKDNSLLSTFLSAFSFTLDEMLTFITLVAPDVNVHYTSPTAVFLGSHEFGLGQDIESVTQTQRKMLRNAVEMYSKKGTRAGLELFAQSATGYDATIAQTTNLFMTYQDSTFAVEGWQSGDPVGSWHKDSLGISIAVKSDQTTVTKLTQPRSLDTVYCAEVEASEAGQSISYGTISPITKGIPVIAEEDYSFSFYARETSSESSTDNLGVTISWYDRFGLLLGTNYSLKTISGATWTRYSVAGMTALPGAYYAGITLKLNVTYPIQFDLVQFENSATVTEYQEPRGAIITLNPTKINYIVNSAFQGGSTTGWTGTNATLSGVNSVGRSGTGFLSVSPSTAAPAGAYASGYMPVTGGQYYSASIYAQDVSTNSHFKIGIAYYAGTTLIGSVNYGNRAEIGKADTWTRLTASFKAPLTATQARVYIVSAQITTGDDAEAEIPAGSIIYFDDAQFEKSSIPTDYFDQYLSEEGTEKQETGAEYAGNYPAQFVREARFISEVEQYLGFNTPYYIDTYGKSTKYAGIA